MSYWKEYNKNLQKFSKQLIQFNKVNNFNFVEDGFYPHVRDILSVTISLIMNSSSNNIKILDYGSNATVWSNLANKISTNKIEVTIYDPFEEDGNVEYLKETFKNIKIVNKLENIKNKNFSLTVFGSVAQYDENFTKNWHIERSFNTEYILLTHTPLSLNETFISKQYSGYKGDQYIHSFEEFLNTLSKDGFEIIFKSVLLDDNARVEEKYKSKTIYANMLFKRL